MAQTERIYDNRYSCTLLTADLNLLLECWSFGVLENRTHDKILPGTELEIVGILILWTSGALDHYSNTPWIFQSGSPVSDLSQMMSLFTLN